MSFYSFIKFKCRCEHIWASSIVNVLLTLCRHMVIYIFNITGMLNYMFVLLVHLLLPMLKLLLLIYNGNAT